MNTQASRITNYLGIDVGSTTVKVVLIDPEYNHLIEPIYIRCSGQPLNALRNAIEKVLNIYDGEAVVGVTGSGQKVVKEALGLPKEAFLTEIYAHSYGAWHVCPGVRTIIDIGGQDNKLIRLQPAAEQRFSITEFVMNELCAAGTGAFLEMHSKELGFASVEEFGQKAGQSVRASRIAGRCSVLAHSDVVHLRQSGEALEHIAAGLCRAVVLNVLAMAGGKPLDTPILFQGGVASNAGMVKALQAELNPDNSRLIVPEYHKTMGAFGAALYASKCCAAKAKYNLRDMLQMLNRQDTDRNPAMSKNALAPLVRNEPVQSSGLNHFHYKNSPSNDPVDLVLGIDVGSASAKIAALDLKGDLVFTFYKLHNGKPFDYVYQGLARMQEKLGAPTVKAVCVTGSGRDNVMLRVGADVNVDEITAQAMGAVMFDPNVEAIFEIGGQDSKFIKIRNGQVFDFEMNRICAAGTGAFIMESAKILGVEPGHMLDELAFESSHPILLSNRCCVFAKSDMVSLLNSGVSRADVAAGIVYAVIKNYLNLVVGNRDTGKRALFLGGLAKSSKAIRSAFKQLRPDMEVYVPPNCDVSGAHGAARIALDEFQKGMIQKTCFRGFAATRINVPVKEFDCNHCTNLCRVKKWRTLDDRIIFTGSICGRYEGISKKKTSVRNFVNEEQELLRSYEISATNPSEEVIGIPRALLYYEQGPLWATFLKELGFQVLISDTGKEAIKKGGLYSSSLVCLPMKVLLGHVADLSEKGVKRIFFPTVVEMERPEGTIRSDNCMLIQAAVDSYLKHAFPQIEIISPVFHYNGRRPMWRRAFCDVGRKLGRSNSSVLKAIKKAEIVQRDFMNKKKKLGHEFLKKVKEGSLCVVLMGHEYSSAPELDMGMSRHFANLGATVAPLSIILPFAKNERLGFEHSDLIFKSSQNMIQGMTFVAKQRATLFPVVLNQFLCRQDACVIPFLNQIAEKRPMLRIMLDENAGDVGLKTRCEAFWHVMKNHVEPSAGLKDTKNLFLNFSSQKHLTNFKGVVWMNKLLRFYAAGYNAIGIDVKFFPEATRETIDRGRKYFPDGEPCLPFIREAGQLEELMGSSTFDPRRDAIHVPGTRHCASTTLPQIYKRVCEKFGVPYVKFVSPRDGLDMAEGVEAFGPFYIQRLVRAMFGEDYLKRVLLSIRPYEANKGESDAVFDSCLEEFYNSFNNGTNFSKKLRTLVERLTSVKTDRNQGLRPKILVTGEYVVRTDPFLNNDIHQKIELLGGEAIRTPLFSDYAEVAGRKRYITLWKLGYHAKSIRELFLSRFLIQDIKKIRRIFAPALSQRIEPDPLEFFKECNCYIDNRLDPVMLLEFYQALWNVNSGDVAGIVNVHPFGCSISTAIEPMLYRAFGKEMPILSLSFDGQANVHMNNRLAAFMECVHAQS